MSNQHVQSKAPKALQDHTCAYVDCQYMMGTLVLVSACINTKFTLFDLVIIWLLFGDYLQVVISSTGCFENPDL